VIRFRDVQKRFGAREVLRGVTLDVPTGSTTVLLGRSGTGKSVLLKHVVGLLVPDGGAVLVDDREVAALDSDGLDALRREIGYVFQFAALFDSLTCEENLELALRRRVDDPDTIPGRIVEALSMVGLPEVGPRYPSELSGGMRKRVGIARAVVLKPRYILWDEPTTGLDPVTTATMDRMILHVQRELGLTSVVVTHDLHSAFQVADRIALLHEGVIRASGTPGEMRASDDPVVRQFIEGRPE
jgi:phospholipid/cholesterol/gamma-HCH transport system ATP-binding protein